MLLVHGRYLWARRLVAFRNDYCLACGAPRLAYRHRTFDVLHVFWIPFLPLGFWKRWHCAVCGNDPHEQVRTRRWLKWVGVVILLLMTLTFWTVPAKDETGDLIFTWVMRLGAPLLAAWAVWATLKSPPDDRLKELLAAVEPNRDHRCPACQVDLIPEDPDWRCPQCGMTRQALAA